MKKYLTDLCIIHFNSKYKYNNRGYHEQLTVNDCFTVFKQKYELINHFDLDEMIFPRNNYQDFYGKNENYMCNNGSKICSYKVFTNSSNHEKPNEKEGNYFYSYVMSLINNKMESDGLKLSEMKSIYFRDSPYLIPNNDEQTLINEMGSFLKESKDNISFHEIKCSTLYAWAYIHN